MSDVVSEMEDTNIKPVMPSDDEPGSPADKQLMVRCTQSEKDLWKKASEASNETLASFVRRILNDAAMRATSCSHPKHLVKFYPWGSPQFFCTGCSKRLEMDQIGQ